MSEQEPTGASGAKPDWLDHVLSEAARVLRASDTLDWLTTDAAAALTKRADEREQDITAMREALTSHSHRVRQFDRAVRFASAEAAMQRKLSIWLAGKNEGDA